MGQIMKGNYKSSVKTELKRPHPKLVQSPNAVSKQFLLRQIELGNQRLMSRMQQNKSSYSCSGFVGFNQQRLKQLRLKCHYPYTLD